MNELENVEGRIRGRMRSIPLMAMASFFLTTPAVASEAFIPAAATANIRTAQTLSTDPTRAMFGMEEGPHVTISHPIETRVFTLSGEGEHSGEKPLLSYSPWLAAGLNYAPTLFGAAMLMTVSGAPNEGTYRSGALLMAVNPMPGLGHLYVGEPIRGLGLFGFDLGLAVVTLGANLALYQGRPPVGEPVPWQENVRNGITLTSIVGAAVLSAWAAWDAFQIAEEKNKASAQQSTVSEFAR